MRRRLSEIWLAGRMLGWLLALPLLKRVMPLESLVCLMWSNRASSAMSTRSDIERMSLIARWLARHAWPRRPGSCLEQSLVLYRFLSARRATPELIIGVRRHNESISAHAWVAVDGCPIGDSADTLSEFSPVVCFGSGGTPTTSGTLAHGLL